MPRRTRRPSAALEGIKPYLTASALGVSPMSAAELIDRMASFAWDKTVVRLSVAAAVLMNGGGAEGPLLRALTIGQLYGCSGDLLSARGRAVQHRLRRTGVGDSIIANEEAIYFLQAMAVVYGADDGPTPHDVEIVELMLAANEYAARWQTEEPDLPVRLRNVANVTRALTFNRIPDPARQIVRAYEMMRRRPARRPDLWPDDESWEAFQAVAFGMPFADYVEQLVLPVRFFAESWGLLTDKGISAPIIDPEGWWQHASTDHARGAQFVRGLSSTRATMKAHLTPTLRTDGLPVGPAYLYRSPFVELPGGQLVLLSPRLLSEHLRGGFWGKHRAAMKSSANWPPAFGDLFEEWCQEVARMAVAAGSVDKIIVPTARGTDDEIEDLVILKNRSVVLISIKASSIPEGKLRGALSASSVVNWFDEFLFTTKVERRCDGQSNGGGAVRRLQAKIDRLRRGDFEVRGLASDLKVYPVIVTYEQGLDSPALYLWCQDRCAEEQLLHGPRVEPVTFASVEDLEGLLALGTRGHSALDILRQKTGDHYRLGRLSNLLHERRGDDELGLRLPELTRRFDEITSRCTRALFGREPSA